MNAEMAKDLVELVSSLKGLKKDKEVEVKTDKGTYKFMYAPLSSILDKIKENKKFSLLQPIFYVEGVAYLENWLIHITGEELKSGLYKLAFRDGTKMQEYGNVITYTRRYSLGSFLGVSTEDEDDFDPELDILSKITKDQIAIFKKQYVGDDWIKFLEKNKIQKIEEMDYEVAKGKIDNLNKLANELRAAKEANDNA